MTRIGALASGNGSNLQALILACSRGVVAGRVVGVVCNRPDAGAVGRAAAFGIPVCLCDDREFDSRHGHEEAILDWLRPRRPEWLVLAGYRRVLSPHLLDAYPQRVINIHPADTRRHQGQGGYAWALEQGLTETLVTVHLVDSGIDTGQILGQAAVPILPGDSLETLTARGLAVEHRLYPETLAMLLRGESRKVLCAAF